MFKNTLAAFGICILVMLLGAAIVESCFRLFEAEQQHEEVVRK